MKLSDFDYVLPPDRIALEPAARRDASRLLVLDRRTGAREHRTFGELARLLEPGDALVLNETRVRLARLIGRRASGGRAECLVVRPHPAGGWEGMIRPGGRVRAGERVAIEGGSFEVVEALEGGRRRVRVLDEAGREVDPEVLGSPALPPYIAREPAPEDRERYQTVYARELGAVAAPTAGLHFTESLLAEIEGRGVELVRVLLHVGPGTFLPIPVDDVEEHRMEKEFFRYPAEAAATLDRVRERGGRVVAVGTTATRVLETVGLGSGPREGWTERFIYPPYSFRAVDALITNFHLPRSTLLLLVAAFAGRREILNAYAEAIERGYRFYSYGDAMFIR